LIVVSEITALYIPVERDTAYLPPPVQDWLPQVHLARFVVESVQQLDRFRLEAKYAGRGSKAYHPSALSYGHTKTLKDRLATIRRPGRLCPAQAHDRAGL